MKKESVKHPAYWQGSVRDTERVVNSVKKGKVSILCMSAGKRPVYLIEYGEKNTFSRTANYSSAVSAHSFTYYADKNGKNYKPCVCLVGAIHGGEWEGTVALNNLLSLIETGFDLAGNTYNELLEAIGNINLLIVPCINPDGRARIPLETMAGQNFENFRYFCQGTWKKDGSLCGYPLCKSIHPIKEASEFLGGYFDDNGVNLMVDNFFFPMAETTKAFLQLADYYVPDITILLHGGGNTAQGFYPQGYLPANVCDILNRLSKAIETANIKAGLNPSHYRHTEMYNYNDNMMPFTLTSAWTALCGEPCVSYESNQGLEYPNAYSMEEIYTHHRILFETTFKFIRNECCKRKEMHGVNM